MKIIKIKNKELKQLKKFINLLLDKVIKEKDIILSVNEGIEENKVNQLIKIYFYTD